MYIRSNYYDKLYFIMIDDFVKHLALYQSLHFNYEFYPTGICWVLKIYSTFFFPQKVLGFPVKSLFPAIFNRNISSSLGSLLPIRYSLITRIPNWSFEYLWVLSIKLSNGAWFWSWVRKWMELKGIENNGYFSSMEIKRVSQWRESSLAAGISTLKSKNLCI